MLRRSILFSPEKMKSDTQFLSAKSPWNRAPAPRAPAPFPSLAPLDAQLDGQDPGNHAVEANDDHANDHGELNYSSVRILRVDEMKEPLAWYAGTKFYVITIGTAVGIIMNW